MTGRAADRPGGDDGDEAPVDESAPDEPDVASSGPDAAPDEPDAVSSEPDAAPDEPDVAPGERDRGGSGRRRPAWRDRRVVVPAVVAVVSLSIAGALTVAGRSGGGDPDRTPLPSMSSTTMDTGGIDVPAPEGWTAAPVPRLGFGIAVPPGWEIVVLDEGMLDSLGRSDPAVTGFVEAAHAAAEAGAVAYAAGEDGQGRVSDLKVRAAPGTGIADVAGLEDHARDVAAEASLTDSRVQVVEDAERPTVRIRFRSTSESPEGERVTVEGVEALVVGPDDIVWSLIVTSETAEVIDDLAPRIVDTLTFPPE